MRSIVSHTTSEECETLTPIRVIKEVFEGFKVLTLRNDLLASAALKAFQQLKAPPHLGAPHTTSSI